jgi:hypothetical protein
MGPGHEFVDYLWRGAWARRFAPTQGWNSEAEKPLIGGTQRVDLAAWSANQRAVAEAKDVAVLSLGHIDQVLDYASTFRATEATVFFAADTHVPETVRDYAAAFGVELARTGWRR